MRRVLNEVEYLNWCVEQPYNMAMAAQVRGEVSPEALRAALDKAQRRHPLLGVTIALDERGRPGFASDGIGPVPLEVLERQGDEQVKVLLERELGTPFEMKAPTPLLRVTLLRPSDPQAPTDVLLCAQHVIADGMSMMFLLRDLLHLMRNPAAEVEVLDAPASADELLPREVRRRVPRSAVKLQLALALLKPYVWLMTRRAPKPGPRSYALALHSWALTAEETSRLLARCKTEGVSVQSALCTSFGPSYPAVNSPVNLRPRLARPVGESVGLYVGSAVVSSRYVERRGFWSNARAFHRRFRRALKDPFLPFRFCSLAVPVETVRAFPCSPSTPSATRCGST